MQYEREESAVGARGHFGVRRNVDAILARGRAVARERRLCFPPDFLHGAVAVGEVYETFGVSWTERAIFVAGTADIVSIAYFDDYFLVVEQWIEGESESWESWWNRRCEQRDRLVVLVTGECATIESLQGVGIRIPRERLALLERSLLGVERDGLVDECSPSGRLRQSQVDVLSLLTLTSRLGNDEMKEKS